MATSTLSDGVASLARQLAIDNVAAGMERTELEQRVQALEEKPDPTDEIEAIRTEVTAVCNEIAAAEQ